MPRILLCAATEFEIAPVLESLPRFEGRVDVLITGVGMLESTWNLAARLISDRPGYLVQAGIAGAVAPGQALGETVLIRRDTVGDLGVEEGGGFRSVFDLGFGDPAAAPWTDGWLVNNSVLPLFPGLAWCDAVTVNEISTAPERIGHYAALGASAESMEGAAFHYAALRSGLPFVQLRSFSNAAGVRDKSRWSIGPAIKQLNVHLLDVLTKLDSI
ncbi:futalosine hydrolase [Flaviaesturariibacter flavus]|uniref:Futalosine hydrolase n=1 Tax=Flaviaesturariibacter flavus TaxID=2502780 RepID=A0A4R1BKK1_9BACT|nr:futalosine hydrolase [Flaviaesturariibacter flavus]TCJ17864.1 futalosine hydrolase [Flaviaesturariibacter flavus]